MFSRQYISLWAIIALAFAQLAIAHHSAVHPEHSFEIAYTDPQEDHHDGHEHDENDQDRSPHECPECLASKSFQTALNAAPVTFDAPMPHISLSGFYTQAALLTYRERANNPRAPPAFLI